MNFEFKDLPFEIRALSYFFHVAIKVHQVDSDWQLNVNGPSHSFFQSRSVVELYEFSALYSWFMSQRAYEHFLEKDTWAVFGDGELVCYSYSCLKPGLPRYQFVFHISEKHEVDARLDAIRGEKGSQPELESEVIPTPRLGSPGWPDDVVLVQGTNWRLLFFPDPSINGYVTASGCKIPIDQIEPSCFSGLSVFVERANRGKFAKSHPEIEFWSVFTPERVFTRLGVFRRYLGESFGLQGYGELTAADLAEMRAKCFENWYRQHFPHLYGVLPVETQAQEVPVEVGEDEEEEFCCVCAKGETGFVCLICQKNPDIHVYPCGCVIDQKVFHPDLEVHHHYYACEECKCATCTLTEGAPICEGCAESDNIILNSCGCVLVLSQHGRWNRFRTCRSCRED